MGRPSMMSAGLVLSLTEDVRFCCTECEDESNVRTWTLPIVFGRFCSLLGMIRMPGVWKMYSAALKPHTRG